ncbi:MAG TPA: zinc ribbon domain-containing protein [Nitrososphaerales archaeon]|nr:zinc ribbon domain-containing protein [Nitrososphaerales archaeon]
MFCGKCGYALPNDADFCPNCGHHIPKSAATNVHYLAHGVIVTNANLSLDNPLKEGLVLDRGESIKAHSSDLKDVPKPGPPQTHHQWIRATDGWKESDVKKAGPARSSQTKHY